MLSSFSYEDYEGIFVLQQVIKHTLLLLSSNARLFTFSIFILFELHFGATVYKHAFVFHVQLFVYELCIQKSSGYHFSSKNLIHMDEPDDKDEGMDALGIDSQVMVNDYNLLLKNKIYKIKIFLYNKLFFRMKTS